MAGAMQIAGTADFYQIPFFIASCDYVVMVDELFASSAYLSRDPTMLGGVVGQDYGKLTLVFLLLFSSDSDHRSRALAPELFSALVVNSTNFCTLARTLASAAAVSCSSS